MITLKEAYFIAKRHTRHPYLYGCGDLGDCWQFDFVWEGFDPDDPSKGMPVGEGIPTVDKKTGRYWEYHPNFHGFELLDREQKEIPVENLTKYDAEFNEKYTAV
jgi:hypothetical protein